MLLRFAVRSLRRHWRKSAVAVLSIASCTSALILFDGYMVDVERMYVDTFEKRQMLGHVIVERAGLTSPGKASADEDALSGEEEKGLLEHFSSRGNDVRAIVRFLNFSGNIQGGGVDLGFTGIAHDVVQGTAARVPRFEWNTLAGEPFATDADEGVLLGKGLADLVGCTWEGRESTSRNGVAGYSSENRPFACPSEPFMFITSTEKGQTNAEMLSVRGLTATGFAELDDRLVMMPLALARRLVDTDRASYITVRLSDALQAETFARDVEAEGARRGWKITARTWQTHDFGDLYVRTMEFLAIFRNFVLSVIVMVAAMAVFSTFSKIIRERRKETATLRSFGYLSSHLLRLATVESMVLGLAGAAVGTVLSLLAIPLVNSLPIAYKAGFLADPVPFGIAFFLPHVVCVWLVVTLLAVTASLLAAWRGLRLSITEGLRDA